MIKTADFSRIYAILIFKFVVKFCSIFSKIFGNDVLMWIILRLQSEER